MARLIVVQSLAMHPSKIRAQLGLDKIPPFKLTDAARSKFLNVRLQDKSGVNIHLSQADIERVEVTLRILLSIDYIHNRDNQTSKSSIEAIDARIDSIKKGQKHLHGLSILFSNLDDKQIANFAIRLHMLDRENQSQGSTPETSKEGDRVRAIYRTIKLLARHPEWFDHVVAGWTSEANRKKQDRWLYLAMDDLCQILIDRDVVLTRNSHSAPFGLVLDALALVRPDIMPAQIDSYLQITRQGVGRSSFGRRWGEIE